MRFCCTTCTVVFTLLRVISVLMCCLFLNFVLFHFVNVNCAYDWCSRLKTDRLTGWDVGLARWRVYALLIKFADWSSAGNPIRHTFAVKGQGHDEWGGCRAERNRARARFPSLEHIYGSSYRCWSAVEFVSPVQPAALVSCVCVTGVTCELA